MLEEMVEMIKTLQSEGSDRHWKINDLTECVESMQHKYFGLKQRMELLKLKGVDYSEDEETCPDQSTILTEIKSCVDELQDTLQEVENNVNPCGGTGWRQLVNLDSNDPDQECPGSWVKVFLNPFGPFVCSQASTDPPPTFPVTEPYSEVCGQVLGVGEGRIGAFVSVLSAAIPPATVAEYEALALGVIITNGVEHVWTFAAGRQPPDNFASQAADINHCPCLLGEEQFFNELVLDLPAFIGRDYFCESNPSIALRNNAQLQVADTLLWDGLNCEVGSQCCNDGTPPIFHKVLSSSTTSAPIQVTTTVRVLQMKIYVR